jgi:multicomponent Na+:H+ antiporter subunit D
VTPGGVVVSWWPAVAVALPLVGVAVSAAYGWTERRRAALLAGLALAALVVALGLIREVLAGRTPGVHLLHMTSQLWMVLRVDAAGALYGATVAGLGLLALVYAFGYVRPGPRRARFFAFFMACLACTLGVAYAGNLLTFLVFYEAFSVLTYALVIHEQTPSAVAAGTKYIAYILVGGSLVLAGVLLTFFLAGDLDFVAGGFLPPDAAPGQLLVAFWCFVAGFGVKAALVPLHGWVPDAHPAAPAPFSALLSGVMVAAGAFGIMRVVFDVFGVGLFTSLGVAPWLTAIAAITVLVGAVLAIGQDDLKRRLAYSTISQMGYLTLAVSLAGSGVMAGGLVHLVHHAFMKGTLFFCAGMWIHVAGARRL